MNVLDSRCVTVMWGCLLRNPSCFIGRNPSGSQFQPWDRWWSSFSEETKGTERRWRVSGSKEWVTVGLQSTLSVNLLERMSTGLLGLAAAPNYLLQASTATVTKRMLTICPSQRADLEESRGGKNRKRCVVPQGHTEVKRTSIFHVFQRPQRKKRLKAIRLWWVQTTTPPSAMATSL